MASTTKSYSEEAAQSPGQYWHAQLEGAQKVFDKWQTRGKKVVKRYRDERDAIESQRKKFNILWSNVQILQPSLYGRQIKPEASRRYLDQDPVGRLASTILERALTYEVEQFSDFDETMKSCVEDRLLPGRGTAWVRFAPDMVTEEPQQSPEQEVAEEGAQITSKAEDGRNERVDSAHSPVDYVYWMDFLHSPSRTWDEVWWVSRWVYMDREEGTDRFGDVFKNVPVDSEEPVKEWQDAASRKNDRQKKAKVAEIWNKSTGKVCWVAKGYPQQLDERDDPLGLEGFFPCPKPLFSTTTNGSLIPVPDYCEYEDQANELDSITNRISNLVRACKAVGVFNGEFKELQRLLNEGIDNKLFPVTAWAAFSEKGGMKGAVDMLDIQTVIAALQQLYLARDACKQTIYETMGLSDILRGASSASETLGAQKLKAQFGSLRLKNSQGDVARFASELLRMKAQLICKFYPAEIIVEMSGVMDTTDGQDAELLRSAVDLLKNSTIRDFKIAVESDTLAQIDEAAEKESAVEIAKAIGDFFKEALPVAQADPEMLPVVSEVLLFTLRRFRAGRPLEAVIERTMRALEDKAKQAAAQPRPDPEVIKQQMEQQAETQRAQMQQQHEAQLAQAEQQRAAMEEQASAQREQQQAAAEQNMESARAAMDQRVAEMEAAHKADIARYKIDEDNKAKIRVAEIQAQAAALKVEEAQDAQDGEEATGEKKPPKAKEAIAKIGSEIGMTRSEFKQSHDQLSKMFADIVARMAKPQKKVLTLPSGRKATIETVGE